MIAITLCIGLHDECYDCHHMTELGTSMEQCLRLMFCCCLEVYQLAVSVHFRCVFSMSTPNCFNLYQSETYFMPLSFRYIYSHYWTPFIV